MALKGVLHCATVHTRVVQLMYNASDTVVVIQLIFCNGEFREFVCTNMLITIVRYLQNACVVIFLQRNLCVQAWCWDACPVG